jgi:hypothetical protein
VSISIHGTEIKWSEWARRAFKGLKLWNIFSKFGLNGRKEREKEWEKNEKRNIFEKWNKVESEILSVYSQVEK